MSGVPPNARQAWAQLQKMAQTAQRGGGGGGGSGPRGLGAGLGGLLLLGGLAVTVNNALFNVDGGHRAIKYTRIGGVKPEIFNEGWSLSNLVNSVHELSLSSADHLGYYRHTF
jgi:prohibitin 2